MESFVKDLSIRLEKISTTSFTIEEMIRNAEKSQEKHVEKAKETLKKKHLAPNPNKKHIRAMKQISEDDFESEDSTVEKFATPAPAKTLPPADVPLARISTNESLRPVRTAAVNASKNLKDIPLNAKMRNDNNKVVIKTELNNSSSVNKSHRESLKENRANNSQQSANTLKENDRRSQSVEIIPVRPVEIDITEEDKIKTHEAEAVMGPPPVPAKKTRQKVAKNNSAEVPEDPTVPIPLRVTRSKIKKEKKSADSQVIRPMEVDQESVIQNQTKVNDTTSDVAKKTGKKKYPMPILIKIEDVKEKKTEEVSKSVEKETPESTSASAVNNDQTFNVPVNETVTINSNPPPDQTVTLANKNNETITLDKNPHESLMTEDNDDEDHDASMDVPLSQMASKHQVPLPPNLKYKNKEVFNPYQSSPVKQKVQAFEKHATTTPDKTKALASKYSTLKAGTPSKIGIYQSKTTPLSTAKQRYLAATVSAASSTSALSATKKQSVTGKKFTSLSHEAADELKRKQDIEEKKRQREEKQRQVQLQREALEKQKREQTLQAQREREEKYKKTMQEKEEQKRLEAIRKKMLKENQEKKYAEEKARKEELSTPMHKQPETSHSASKDNSLHLKMQKQILLEKSAKHKQQQNKNFYSFDMLDTDDSTDDESNLSRKRPEPPNWSKKSQRKKAIVSQSYVNTNVLDCLFSSQPINVDLKKIFPAIEARKLIRNSSAVWNTPPRYSQIPRD